MEYHSMKELFAVADAEKCSPGIIACRVEAEESGKSYEEIWARMKYTIPIFRESIQKGLSDTSKSASGLVGGDGMKMRQYCLRGEAMSGGYVSEVIAEALSMAESNACMRRIVAAPTAGACGVLPAVLLRPLPRIWRSRGYSPGRRSGRSGILSRIGRSAAENFWP